MIEYNYNYVAFKITQTDKDFLKDANIIIWTTTIDNTS